MEIYLEHFIDTGHRIVGHKGKCARLHGHTYRFEIWISGEIVDPGFVVDFGDVKDILNTWDHRTLLWDQDPLWQEYIKLQEHGVIAVPFNPTAENMAQFMADYICDKVNAGLVTLKVWETPKCHATAYSRD